jgi:acid phosphatase type 7
MRMILPLLLVALMGSAGSMRAAPTFSVAQAELPDPLVIIAYGDMRFTQPQETDATSPTARRALVAKIAAENPAAVFISGDIPWHGVEADYEQFRRETKIWRDAHLRVYPALGNHEFSACLDFACLNRWWNTFPELRGRRWYSVALGDKVLGLVLDSDTSLQPKSEQRRWLESQISELSDSVRLVLIVIHHPPLAAEQTHMGMDHNARANEQSIADYLSSAAPQSKARFIVSAGHIHNYERLARDGVVYLVSGGGGAKPLAIERLPADLFQNPDFPNYHYVRLQLHADQLLGEMIRLNDYAAAAPRQWQVRDRFEVSLPP